MAEHPWRPARQRPCPGHRLAERLGHDLDAYTEVKDPACDLVMVAAEAWASAG